MEPWNNFITWYAPQGLVSMTPPFEWRFMYVYIALTAAFWILGIALAFTKFHPELKAQINAFLWTNAVLGVLLFFTRWLQIPYLGMDILRLVQEIGIVAWIGFIVWFYKNRVVSLVVEDKVQEYKTKYLPKRKA